MCPSQNNFLDPPLIPACVTRIRVHSAFTVYENALLFFLEY